MTIEERKKNEENKVFTTRLDEMLFRLKYIFPNGNK